ncbi:MAG: tetratricopeptide repeat protein [Caldilinea sp. CFX5]|nr:tetratricopeptide repeat protein [Caldilinea sp. CFX5]
MPCTLKGYSWITLLFVCLPWLFLGCVSQIAPIPAPRLVAPTPTLVQPTALPLVDSELTAVITQVRGRVTMTDEAGEASALREVRPLQIVRAGALLRLADDAQLGIICASEHWIQLTGVNEWQLSEQNCQSGRLLPVGTYESAAPTKGRIVELASSLLIAERTRESETDYGNIPVILSPRNTSLLDLQPAVQWVAVEGAIEYQLGLSGLAPFDNIVLDAADVACTEESDAAGNRVCTVAWPSIWVLEPGQRYFLTVSARTGIASKLRASETSALRTLTDKEAAITQSAIADIQRANLATETQGMLLATLYAEQGLYAQAITMYEQVLTSQPTPAVYVTLGDLYRAIDLQRYAFNAYQQALDQLAQGEDDLPMRAAAEFGLGQVEYSRGNFQEAELRFGKAVELYTQLDAEGELQATQQALEEARRRR